MRTPVLLVAVFPLFIGACCSRGAAPATPVAAKSDIAPRPFTADEIRDGMPVGHELRYRIEEPGKPVAILRMRVVAADAASVTIASDMLDEQGNVVADQGKQTSQWTALLAHATWPADKTTRTEATVSTPAGDFPSIDYVVRKDDGSVTTYRFAKTLPGPPVWMATEKDGTAGQRMVLIGVRKP